MNLPHNSVVEFSVGGVVSLSIMKPHFPGLVTSKSKIKISVIPFHHSIPRYHSIPLVPVPDIIKLGTRSTSILRGKLSSFIGFAQATRYIFFGTLQ